MNIKTIPLSLVKPSPMNPRKTFEQEELEELAANIEKQGLLQPITVRPKVTQVALNEEIADGYEIVCGERRYRAYCLLKAKEDALNVERSAAHCKKHNRFQSISAIVREMNDAEAFDAMITENLQRKDVDPMEEAFAFGQLIERGSTAEDIALRFGKSIRFVQDRIKLNALIPELMVAVKDGTMSISAAMLISKLNEEQQRDFFKKNKEQLNKWNVERYVNNLFMYLHNSVWSEDEPDFAGTTCGTSCRECQFNTCNHGCLFYEMKTDEKNGKCTSRERFEAKTEEYAFHVIEQHSERLVKVGEPLAKGKIVVGVSIPTYYQDRDKAALRKIEEKVRACDYEVVNSDEYFDHCVSYDLDDERTQEFLENGTAYLVLDLYRYTALHPILRAYYLKHEDNDTNCSEAGIPSKVVELMKEYKRENIPADYTVTISTAIGNNAEATINALNDTERIAICAAILRNDYMEMHKRGFNSTQDEEILSYIKGNLDVCFNSILRAYLINQLKASNNQTMHIIGSLLPDLGRMWCEEACEKAVKEYDTKKKKKLDKLTKQLSDLGYTPDGKPFVVTDNVAAPNPDAETIKKQFNEMKAKHPDAILIFRIGDFYLIFNEDAEVAAPILGLNQAPWHAEPTINQCGFIHSSLDTYLPKLVRAGKRVAICESLTDPKK